MEVAEVTLEQAQEIVNLIFATITKSLLAGEPVAIRGWGIFDVHHRDKYNYGRNCYFRPAYALRYLINDGYQGKDPDDRSST